jgi:hypothetical protein
MEHLPVHLLEPFGYLAIIQGMPVFQPSSYYLIAVFF